MVGMVMTPVVSTLVTTLPLIEPMRPLAKMATFAGPPLTWPRSENARLRKNEPPPVCCRATPKIRNPMTRVPKARIGIPKMASLLMAMRLPISIQSGEDASRIPGS